MVLGHEIGSDFSISEGQIRDVYAHIRRICTAARLGPEDSEELAQDVWNWVLESGNLPRVTIAPWLAEVVGNFLRRLWKRRTRQRKRLTLLVKGPGCVDELPSWEAHIFVENLTRHSEGRSRILLEQLCQDRTFPEAATAAGVPRGSWYHQRQLLARLARPKSDRGSIKAPLVPPLPAARRL